MTICMLEYVDHWSDYRAVPGLHCNSMSLCGFGISLLDLKLRGTSQVFGWSRDD